MSRAKTRTMSSKSAVPILKDQHRLVERLFQRLVRTRPKEERRACFEVLADHLAAHTAIEERFFYPAAKVRQTEQLLEHAAHEHLEAKQLISDLMKRRDVNGREFSSKVKKLEKAIHDHVREEESTLFPAVQKLFTSGELAEIGANMQELFVQLIEREPRQDVPAQAFQPISLD